ncbi:MAG: hypothetical protein HFJ86_05205 [Oscillospiraceae bacterium]|jgi:hypothetical protein|nr:hypothetical protein [Oscillospiraceae bacterium]
MGFVDELLDKAKYVAAKAGEKTNELVEVSRLKLACVGLNTNLEKQYQKLGHIVYDMVKSEENNEEAVFQCVDEIDQIMAEMQEINGKIDEMKGNICPTCKKVNPEGAVYCCFCGGALKTEKPCDEPCEEEAPCEEAPCECGEDCGCPCEEEAPCEETCCCCGEEAGEAPAGEHQE